MKKKIEKNNLNEYIENIAKFSCCIITKGKINLEDTIEVSNRYDSDFLSPWSSNDKIEIF